jgi:hypothetical protein
MRSCALYETCVRGLCHLGIFPLFCGTNLVLIWYTIPMADILEGKLVTTLREHVNNPTVYYHMSVVSNNGKVNGLPVSTTSNNTCDPHCGLRLGNGCFGDNFTMAMHWIKVSSGDKRALNLDQFVESILSLPDGIVWRHNQVGDLPGLRSRIDTRALSAIVRANRSGRKRGFTYTHKRLTSRNVAIIRWANKWGFTINISCDSLAQADIAKRKDAGPVTVVVSEHATNHKTPEGHQVVICPEQTAAERGKVTRCGYECKLCAMPNRPSIVGFRAHGSQKRKAEALIQIAPASR